MDFLESFPLHERTYKYHARNFNFTGDNVTLTPEEIVRLDCERCTVYEEVTRKAMATYATMILPLFIRTLNTEDHYLLCQSCRFELKGKVKEWVKTGNFS